MRGSAVGTKGYAPRRWRQTGEEEADDAASTLAEGLVDIFLPSSLCQSKSVRCQSFRARRPQPIDEHIVKHLCPTDVHHIVADCRMNLTLVNDVASSRIVLVLVSVACNAVTVVRDRRGMSSRSSRSGTTAPWMQTKLRLTTDRSRADIHLFHGRKYTQAAVEPTGQERASTLSMGASTRRLPSSRRTVTLG